MPVRELGDVAKAALASKFAEIHGAWKVHVTAREALVVYLVPGSEGRGSFRAAVGSGRVK